MFNVRADIVTVFAYIYMYVYVFNSSLPSNLESWEVIQLNNTVISEVTGRPKFHNNTIFFKTIPYNSNNLFDFQTIHF